MDSWQGQGRLLSWRSKEGSGKVGKRLKFDLTRGIKGRRGQTVCKGRLVHHNNTKCKKKKGYEGAVFNRAIRQKNRNCACQQEAPRSERAIGRTNEKTRPSEVLTQSKQPAKENIPHVRNRGERKRENGRRERKLL